MGKEWCVFYRGNRWMGKRPARWMPMGIATYKVLTNHKTFVMQSRPFRGVFCVEVRRKTWGPAAHSDALIERRVRPSMKKVKLSDRSSVKHLAPLETEYLREAMPVIEALAMLQYEDGTARAPGYLGVWTNGATWYVRITDKDAEAQLTTEGRTFDEAMDTMTLHLGSENAPWEPVSRRKKKGT